MTNSKMKILVSKHSETSFFKEFDINRFPAFIGRDEKNEIFLEDHFKVISRKHAQIIKRDGFFYLIDLESQNFTYLNGQRVQPDEEKLLQSNDKIKIGEYELEVQILKEEAAADNDQKTMVFAAPFEEELGAISENLKSIFQKFSADDSPMKSEMLRFSLMQKFNKLEKNDVNKIFAEFFDEHFLENKSSKEDKFSSISKDYKSPQNFEEQPRSIIQQKNYSDEPQLKPDYSFSSHFSDVTDLLLDAFCKLILGSLQFRQEFFGVTMYQILPVENLNDLKEYLFNPAVSSEEEKKRLSLLKDETQKLLAHQIGLLEGYRISIIDGTKNLLQSLDPETLEKEVFAKNQKPSFLDNKLFSFAQKARLLDTIKKTYGKYHSDPYYIEKKFFRPAFMKGYQRRNISGKSQDEY